MANVGHPKRFGYRAVFHDGSVRTHATNFKKTHCVRCVMSERRRWQYDYKTQAYRWFVFPGGHTLFHFAHSEEEAMQLVERFMRETCEHDVRAFKYQDTLNAHLWSQWYYSLVEAVELQVEWEAPVTVCELAPELCGDR